MSFHIDGPIRLEDTSRILSRADCEGLARRILGFTRGGGKTNVRFKSWWQGELRWGRNRVSLAGDRRDVQVRVIRMFGGGAVGVADTNQFDEVSLEAVVRAAEREARVRPRWADEFEVPPPPFEFATPTIWSDKTYLETAQERGVTARTLIDPSEANDMMSAGYLEARASAEAVFPAEGAGPAVYAAMTRAQCSMTVRDQKGTGSGWAGLSSYDLGAIDAPALAARALEKALASRNPVALEPGRYTVILEPQAVHDLVSLIVRWGIDRSQPEFNGQGPFAFGYDNALELWRSKLGLKVVDERITMSHDPMDPQLGVMPFDGPLLEPVRAVKWIDRGVLTALSDGRQISLPSRNDNLGYPNSHSYRLSGGTTSVEEMISTTKRGLLVTRFSNISLLDGNSLLSTGLTRDGLWLIENGKVTKAVKNFRFTDSPLFVLNSLEQLGVPVPVFELDAPAIVPPLKARDFSFTSMIDAV